MIMRIAFFGSSLLTFAAGTAMVPVPATVADEKSEVPFARLAGKWKIEYSSDATRGYIIDRDGSVSYPDANLKGKITRQDNMLLLVFEDDDKLERLTPAIDGRLLVEHYNPKANFPGKRWTVIGIGVREK